MPERIGWSEHEAALLLWILQDVLNGKMNRQDAIREASKMLRTMALNQGKTIDDAYRNEAGITFQLYGLEGVWLNGKTPIGRKTTWMTNICDVYRRNHQRFDRLVQEAKEMPVQRTATFGSGCQSEIPMNSCCVCGLVIMI